LRCNGPGRDVTVQPCHHGSGQGRLDVDDQLNHINRLGRRHASTLHGGDTRPFGAQLPHTSAGAFAAGGLRPGGGPADGKNLTTDSTLPRGVRVRLALLMVYLALPIDLVPDFIPVLGYADDAVVAVFVLRGVVRRVGLEPLRGHWSGTQDGFAALCRLAGLETQAA
jgi:Protein of unknown function (DUF1232)